MAKDLNKVQVIGRLTKEVEVRQTTSGMSVASITIATNYSYKDQSGQLQEQAEFHDIVAWGKLSDICGQYLHKGSRVYFEGRLQTRSWTGNDEIKRYRTEIVANDMIMLDSKGSTGNNETSAFNETPAPAAKPKPAPEKGEVSIEDVPF
jgi:single-strand DNA-binding protein